MNKTINIIFAILLIIACDNKEYNIKGYYPGVPDGTKIYMTDIDDISINIDSAIVHNGKFIFTGKQETPVMRMILSSASLDGGPVVLQNGTIKVRLNNGIKRKGTPLNNDLQEFFDARERMSVRTSDIINNYLQQQEVAEEDLNTARKEFVQTLQRVIGNNMDNALGAFLLTQSENYFTSQELYSIMSQIPVEVRNKRFTTMYERLGNEFGLLARAAATDVGCKNNIDFELFDNNGNKIIFSQIVDSHKYTLLDFWASWCPPCRQEIPVIKEIYNKYKKDGIAIVSVSLDSSSEEWQEAISSMQMDWIQLCSPNGGSDEIAAAYGITTIPTSLLIDSQGYIIMRGKPAYRVEEKLKELLNTK